MIKFLSVLPWTAMTLTAGQLPTKMPIKQRTDLSMSFPVSDISKLGTNCLSPFMNDVQMTAAECVWSTVLVWMVQTTSMPAMWM